MYPKEDEIKMTSKDKIVERLAKLYPENRAAVALICDEVLDRTGELLGIIRDKATKS